METHEVPVREHFHSWVHDTFPKGCNSNDSSNWTGMNGHWEPQVHFCAHRIRDLHTYFNDFRFEDMEKLVDYMYSFIPDRYLKDGFRQKPRGQNEETNLRDHILLHNRKVSSLTRILDMFSLDLYDHLSECFHEEIIQLGYQREVAEARVELARHENKQ